MIFFIFLRLVFARDTWSLTVCSASTQQSTLADKESTAAAGKYPWGWTCTRGVLATSKCKVYVVRDLKQLPKARRLNCKALLVLLWLHSATQPRHLLDPLTRGEMTKLDCQIVSKTLAFLCASVDAKLANDVLRVFTLLSAEASHVRTHPGACTYLLSSRSPASFLSSWCRDI